MLWGIIALSDGFCVGVGKIVGNTLALNTLFTGEDSIIVALFLVVV